MPDRNAVSLTGLQEEKRCEAPAKNGLQYAAQPVLRVFQLSILNFNPSALPKRNDCTVLSW